MLRDECESILFYIWVWHTSRRQGEWLGVAQNRVPEPSWERVLDLDVFSRGPTLREFPVSPNLKEHGEPFCRRRALARSRPYDVDVKAIRSGDTVSNRPCNRDCPKAFPFCSSQAQRFGTATGSCLIFATCIKQGKSLRMCTARKYTIKPCARTNVQFLGNAYSVRCVRLGRTETGDYRSKHRRYQLQ